MIDMSQNRVPYGLLTDEEKSVLHRHVKAGGELVFTGVSRDIWDTRRTSLSFYDHCVYRIVPLTQDEIAWDRLPDWAEWVVRDSDGDVIVFEGEPGKLNGMWEVCSGNRRRIDDFPGIVIKRGTCDWKDSKQRKPSK